MTRNEIEHRIRLPLSTCCLAAAAGDARDLTAAKWLLVDEIEKIIITAIADKGSVIDAT